MISKLKMYSLIFSKSRSTIFCVVILSLAFMSARPMNPLVFQKYSYVTYYKSDGTILKERVVESLRNYNRKGQLIRETIFVDYTLACDRYSRTFNRPKTPFIFWFDYQYDSTLLIQETERKCDSLVHLKHFYSYKFNNLNQIKEKQELLYRFKRYINDDETNNIGDSVLLSTIITSFTYNKKGDIIKEKVEENGFESSATSFQYHRKGKLLKVRSVFPDFVSEKKYKYFHNQLIGKVITTDNWKQEITYTYNAKGLLILDRMKQQYAKDSDFRYFYDENDQLVKTEEFDGYTLIVREFEYTYY